MFAYFLNKIKKKEKRRHEIFVSVEIKSCTRYIYFIFQTDLRSDLINLDFNLI